MPILERCFAGRSLRDRPDALSSTYKAVRRCCRVTGYAIPHQDTTLRGGRLWQQRETGSDDLNLDLI